ncbi:MAG TPA: peptidylprolyl isomerase, partial [Gemmatimonadales bacterium]|nr:peptidylprolyl isomerase [Gemmatimonadales bacterium]
MRERRGWGFKLGIVLLLQSLNPSIPQSLHAQSDLLVEAIAPIIAAEDARTFDESLLRRSTRSPDSLVRRIAALSAGRVGDLRAIPLLLPLLVDPDTLVESNAAFALGLLADSSVSDDLIRRLEDPEQPPTPAALEMVTALAKTGGAQAGAWFRSLLAGSSLTAREDRDVLVRRAVTEAWRLGKHAPVDGLLGMVGTNDDDLRWNIYYSLGRLRAPAAASRMVDALADRYPLTRATAARTLTKGYADSSRLEGESVARLLLRATGDVDPGVRVQAVRSLATFKRGDLGARATVLLDDAVPGVAVEAATAMRNMPDPKVATELVRVVSSSKGASARRRAALVSLAAVDSAAFLKLESSWTNSSDWRERSAAADAWAKVRHGGRREFFQDADGRVVAAALEAWGTTAEDPDTAYIEACRRLLNHRDAAVRSLAADGLAKEPAESDIPALIKAYRAGSRDSFPEARLSDLAALKAIAKLSETAAHRIDQELLNAGSPPEDYLVRRWAEENWPEAAAKWGSPYPVRTGRTMEDYRDITRSYLVGESPTRYPHVKVDVDQLGVIELELFGPEAPLTVNTFLKLVDRGFFNGQRFHRMVPNFVVQTGDPRGDGWGGPGGAIRDEINLRRYKTSTVGMALSGPDTGASQWFITLGPQPHLDGIYTVF